MSDATSGRGDLPEAEVLRRRLRTALTRARNDVGLTQKAVAEMLDWSPSKVVRIEQGTVPVSPTDVRAMLGAYEVTDVERVDELVNVAREERRAKSWSEYDQVLSKPLREMLGQEGAATTIWKYEPSVVPGFFQTATYAQVLLAAVGMSPEDVQMMSEVRSKRRAILSPEPPGPDLHVVIGEAALTRPVGGDKVMREQIRDLIELGDRPGIFLYYLPLSAGPHPAMGQAFTVMQFDTPDLEDSLYLEDGGRRVSANDDREEILLYLNIYNTIEGMAESNGSFQENANRILDNLYS